MNVFALESATRACSVALWIDGAVVAVDRADLPRGQAEALVPMVETVRRRAGIAFAEIDRFAVTIGPGHFTGLRVGLATARGLALAVDRPLVGIGTLAAVAAAVSDEERQGATLLVALDSKRAEPYLQAFDARLRPVTQPAAVPIADYVAALLRLESTGPFIVAGDAGDPVVAELTVRGATARGARAALRPDAAVVAMLGAAAPLPSVAPGPLYLHPVEITTPTKAALSLRP